MAGGGVATRPEVRAGCDTGGRAEEGGGGGPGVGRPWAGGGPCWMVDGGGGGPCDGC